jgi:hypothetical protein
VVDVYTETKFSIEQFVFTAETIAREKLTENVSLSFVVNILTRQFPQKSCVSKLVKKWLAEDSVCGIKKQ